MLYSVVIPCYKSSHTIRQVVEETAAELTKMGRTPFEFVLTDDCSPDGGETVRELRRLADDYDYVKVIELAKNGGQHNASLAGMNYAEGDFIISMDDDMQTHPSQLSKLFEKIEEGYDIVYAYYPGRKYKSPVRSIGTWMNFTTVRVLIGKPKDMKTSSFFIIRKYVRDYAVQYRSKYTHLQGLFLRTTALSKIASVPVEHHERAYGQSGYSFKKLVGLWSNLLGFSIVPLRFAQYSGMILSLIGVIGAIVILIRKLILPSVALGWSSIMVAICFFSGMIMFFLGLLGEYIGRLFQDSTNSPQYVVRTVYTQGCEDAAPITGQTAAAKETSAEG